ncbi:MULTISPECIES: hypothetical protein [Chryseobacterium]|uniref:hypothetical protein n=1 Tax=Chryseobacterium TaxID=59732 RepID=UPI0003FD50D8|nr:MULTISPECIES: hypothetical protein [Chryseobacterium]MDR6156609.1 hypothetical protein [Chryseobacterium sp. SLBN-27]
MSTKIFNIIKSFFNIIIITTSLILVGVSASALFIVQKNLCNDYFDPSILGLNNYIKEFSEFKELFAATITLIVAYFGILRLTTAEVANREKVKQDRFNEWKNLLDIRIIEVEKNNNFFKRQFADLRWKLFERLYENKMEINSAKELNKIFDDKMRSSVRFLEENNDKYFGKEVSPDKHYSYMYTDFQFIFLGLLDKYYDGMEDDLKNIILNSLNPQRVINYDRYISTFK